MLEYNAVGCYRLASEVKAGQSYRQFECGIAAGVVFAGDIQGLDDKSALELHAGYARERHAGGLVEYNKKCGIGYSYFREGLHGKGYVYGITPVYVVRPDDTDVEFNFSFGYQFK